MTGVQTCALPIYIDENSPTLTYNQIGRHISCLVDTKITSNLSPWLWGTETDDIYTIPVSHGEGRFVAPQSVIDKLATNGQIATQYVDPSVMQHMIFVIIRMALFVP